ncbi:hypothetical protein EXIGLDRAFT_728140 [Exidia glandulosa HHB12029]|uniref:DUF6593 domain-containing protein n=1 Tax=Exidia glandulosa HHB12029 TaxID=1314781 RepID=A0A166B6U1_EXIGL|nr:hypothetical protein EXIGLDRAFT_728140 [Exidia glandulosa HHB12029]
MSNYTAPLQPVGETHAIPRGLDTPTHEPTSPGTGYLPPRDIPAQTQPHVGQDQHVGQGQVIIVTAPEPATVYAGSGASGYTMHTAFVNRHEVVTIARGAPQDSTVVAAAAAPNTIHEAGADGVLARLELHDLRSNKLTLEGGQTLKLRDWLKGTATNTHSFTVGNETYEWRRILHGLEQKFELFAPGSTTPIAFAQKGHGLPASQDPNYTSVSQHLGSGLPMAAQTESQAYSTTSKHEHVHANTQHALPEHPANARITLTPLAEGVRDWVVVSYLLMDRELRPDPLQG